MNKCKRDMAEPDLLGQSKEPRLREWGLIAKLDRVVKKNRFKVSSNGVHYITALLLLINIMLCNFIARKFHIEALFLSDRG